MIRDFITRIQSNFADPEAVAAYQTVVPRTINVTVNKSQGVYVARIDSVNNDEIKGLLVTEAESYDDMIHNVNDLVYSYIKMPAKYRPFYGNVLQPTNNKKSGELELVKA